MSTERTIAIDLIRDWIWRCEQEDIQVAGSELYLINPEGPSLIPLAQTNAAEVTQEHLRHTCGSPVIAIKQIRKA